jgi:hypothetical protein
MSNKALNVIMESDSTRPSVPINVANNPALMKLELSRDGVTCAMIDVSTPKSTTS